jgi:carboxymethylenebutenolidase
MKNLLLISFVSFSIFSVAQDEIICHTPSTEKFALFASNKMFNSNHLEPLEFVHISQSGGEMVKLKCTDGTEANAYLLKAKSTSDNWIFVFQEWWGLNDQIKKQAEDLYNDLRNVNVIALDMYDGKLTSEREAAGKYMSEFKQERGDIIVKAALTLAGLKAKVGTIGWCFGGGQSLLATLTAGKQAAACVMYYGMPVEDVAILKTLNCDVLNIWGTQDQWINKDVMDKFSGNMNAAGKNLTIKSYDADHAFANPSNPGHNKEYAADAYKNSLEFFKSRLK